MALVGGSLISGPGLTERAHWTVIAMVRGEYSAWDTITRIEVTTERGTFRGDAMLAAAPIVDGGEIRTGLTAFAESVLEPVNEATEEGDEIDEVEASSAPGAAAQLRSPSQLRSPHCVVAACQAKPAP